MEFQNDNKKQKNSSKTKIQKNSQFCTQINEKMVQILNQSCHSLDLGKRRRSSNEIVANTQPLNQTVNQGNFLATKLNRRISFDNHNFNCKEKTFRKSKTDNRILKVSKTISKQTAKKSKSKTSRHSDSGKIGKYTKRKYYKYKNENNPETDLYQAKPINKDTSDASTIKKRINKLYGSCSTENQNVVCYESDYKLTSNKSEQITTIISSLNFTKNNLFEENDNFHKLFKVRTRQEMKLHNQRNDMINEKSTSYYTSDDNQDIDNYSTISQQRVDYKYKQNRRLDNEEKTSNNFSATNVNIVHSSGTTANKQEESRKLFDEFLQDYVNNAHRENDKINKIFPSSIKQQDKRRLLSNFSTQTFNNEENNNLSSNSFIEKIKQHIVKLADKITPKIIDNVPKDVNYMNFIIDEIKLQEIVKLFHNNSSKLHKENNISTKPTNLLYSKEREINKLNGRFSINHRTDQNIKKDNSKNNPAERKIRNKFDLKQKEAFQVCDNFLVGHFDPKESTFAAQQHKIMKLPNSSSKSIHNIHSILSNKSIDRNISHVNSLIIKVKSKTNYEVNKPTSKELIITKDAQSWSKSTTTPNLRLHKLNACNSTTFGSVSSLNVPYGISVKSNPKINMEKVRPNSKFTIKNTLLQNDGIYHPNKRMKRQIEEIGIENVSESSSSPQLNENPLDIPYQVSLMSLPSNAKPTTKRQFNNFSETYNLSKLNYYSNLDTNFKRTSKNTYEVRYFELKNNYKSDEKSEPTPTKDVEQQTDSIDDNTATISDYSTYTSPYGQAYEVRVFEYDDASDTDLPMAMSTRHDTRGGAQLGGKSKYYSYPDDEDYIRNARRKSTLAAERRPEAGQRRPEADPRRPVDRNAPGTSHYHGESRLALEPWAPFSISDTSLPGARSNKNKKDPPVQTQMPTTPSIRSDNLSRGKEAGHPNMPATATMTAYPIAGMHPVMLTPELLDKITRGNNANGVPQNAGAIQNVNPISRSRNIPHGTNNNFQTQQGNRQGFPLSCTVSTDTDGLCCDPRKGKVMIDTPNSQYYTEQSFCCPCESKSSQTVKNENSQPPYSNQTSRNRASTPKQSSTSKKETQQGPCGKICTPKQSGTAKNENPQTPLSTQLNRSETCTPKQPNTDKVQSQQTKQNIGNDNTSQSQVHKCGLLKEICLCDYTGKYHGACGSTPKENEATNKIPDNKPNTSCCNNDKASDSQGKKNTSSNFKSYNHNPHVMYCLGEQRNAFHRTEKYIDQNQTTSQMYYNSDKPSKLSYSLGPIDSTDPSLHNHEEYSKPQKSFKHQENIIQFCLEPQSNSIKVPRHQNPNQPRMSLPKNKLNDIEQQYELKKIQTDKYYVLCLPNEPPVSNEQCNFACFPHTEFITPHDDSSGQLHKLDINDPQYDKASVMLQSYLHSNSDKEPKLLRNKKQFLTSNLTADELWGEKFNDSTIYVFQAQPKLDNRRWVNHQKQSTIMRDVEASADSDIPIKEKTKPIKLDKESNTKSMNDNKFKSNTYHTQTLKNKNVEPHYYSPEHNEANNNKSNTSKHSYKKLFKDGYKHSILLMDDNHNSQRNTRDSSKDNMKAENSSSKRIQYCSIGINTDSAQDVINNEAFTNQSCFDEGNPSDYTAPSPINSNCVIEFLNTPINKEMLMPDCTQDPDILLKKFGIQVASNKVIEGNEAINKRCEAIHNIQEHSKGKEHLTRNLVYGCLPQNIKRTYSSDTESAPNCLINDYSKEIPIHSDTSKYSIIISQLADTSSCTQNILIPSSLECLNDITICGKKSHIITRTTEMNTDDEYCDTKQLVPTYSSIGTQSPPVVYRSKISDFIEKTKPRHQFPKELLNLESERLVDSCNLANPQREHEKCFKTAAKCANASIQTDDQRENDYKTPESTICMVQCNLEKYLSSNVKKNPQKINKVVDQSINTNDDKENEAPVQYVDRTQQMQDVINTEIAFSGEEIIANSDNEIICCGSKTQTDHNKIQTSNHKDNIVNDALNEILSKMSSTNPINTSTVPLARNNSDTYSEVYKSRLFSCNSMLSLPIQLPNQKSNFGLNSFWIPPDYDDSEFNVYASDSKLSHYSNFKDNNDHNISRKSSQISATNGINSVCNTDQDNTQHPNKSLITGSNNHSQGTRTQSCVIPPRGAYQKTSFSTRIVPVTLAMSQENCKKVSSGPIRPVVLAISQEDHQKDSTSAPVILSSINYLNKQNLVGQQMHEAMDNGKNEDKVYWALTKVKTHRDGSQDLEILDATPIPPGHFLVPTANNVVLVENRPYISAENKQVNRK